MTFTAAIALSVAVTHAVRFDDDTHGRNATPDYDRVFAQDRVNRLDITISAADWQAVLADMQDMAGAPGGQVGGGAGGQPPGGPGQGFSPAALAACTGRTEGSACTFGAPPATGRCVQTATAGTLACTVLGGGAGGGGVGGGGGGNQAGGLGGAGRDDVELLPRTPVYVPADLTFDGETFTHVGFRLKGNSSLVNTWRSGSEKLPFRLNIDGLEDRFPEARDQTFFGFPNLSFSNNALDSSYLRAKVVTDMFADAGLPVARTSFMRVYLDRGAGPFYLGLYTMIEVPDSPMLDRLFGSDEGNLYKPHSTGGRWTVFEELDFPKKTNAADEDWTDVEDAIAALNASKADRALWRSRLDARLSVSGFLRWLALNTIVGNFDAYGGLSAHNYYVYGSPRHRDRLFWIPWDHDLAMSTSGGGLGGGLGGGSAALNLFHTGVASNWPLIRFLMDDPVYRAAYRGHVENLLATVFEPSRLGARFRTEQARIVPFVFGAEGEAAGRSFAGTAQQFDAAVYGPAGFLAFIESRRAAVAAALQTNP